MVVMEKECDQVANATLGTGKEYKLLLLRGLAQNSKGGKGDATLPIGLPTSLW